MRFGGSLRKDFRVYISLVGLTRIFRLLGESNNDSAYCDRSARVPSVCLSVTLVHPAKAVARNETPFGRDSRVIPSNIA